MILPLSAPPSIFSTWSGISINQNDPIRCARRGRAINRSFGDGWRRLLEFEAVVLMLSMAAERKGGLVGGIPLMFLATVSAMVRSTVRKGRRVEDKDSMIERHHDLDKHRSACKHQPTHGHGSSAQIKRQLMFSDEVNLSRVASHLDRCRIRVLPRKTLDICMYNIHSIMMHSSNSLAIE
jgi:hypothetical protein